MIAPVTVVNGASTPPRPRTIIETEPPTGSQKVRLMEYLRKRAAGDRPFHRGAKDPEGDAAKHGGHKRRGWTGSTVRTISADLGMSAHDVVHALYDLRKRELVKFATSKSPGRRGAQGEGGSSTPNGIPVRIQVTAAGMDPEALRKSVAAEKDVQRIAHELTADRLVPVRADPASPFLDHLAGRHAVEPAAPQEPRVDQQSSVHEPDGHPGGVPGLPSDEAVGAPLAGGPTDEPVVSGPTNGGFPLITRLIAERSKLDHAAALLRDAGRTDLADLVASEAKLTELETEVLAWVDSHRTTPSLDPTPIVRVLARILATGSGGNLSSRQEGKYPERLAAFAEGRQLLEAWRAHGGPG